MTHYGPRTLGKYQIEEKLGRGGTAEVYRAFQPGLDRHVAIKVLHPHLADTPDFVGRFRREAQAVARLHHPHIVQMFDFDVQDNLPYMVMEFVPGTTLKSLLDEAYHRGERTPTAEVLRIFRAVLDAIGYAHGMGMVHRDLKPANVLIDARGRPVLTDFGIAKIVGAEKFTSTGVIVGTPAYMSPEQGQGEPGDERSDLYALGVMLFECLAGHVPYEADTSMAVLLKHLTAPIPPLHESWPEAPAPLEQIVTRSLAKDPDERYQSAGDMWAALAAMQSAAEAPTPLPRAQTAPAAPRSTAAQRPVPTHTQAEPHLKRAAQATNTSRARVNWPIASFSALAAAALLIAAVLFYPRPAGPSPAEQAVAQGQAHLAAGNAQLAADSFAAALAIEPENVPALLGRATAYEQLGDVEGALADLEQVIGLAPEDPVGYAERARITLQYGFEAGPAAALADFDRAIQLAPDSARFHFLRGWGILNFALVGDAPNPLAAVSDLLRAAALAPQDAEIQFTLARALLGAQKAGDALTAANRAVELAPQDAVARTLRAHIQFVRGDFHAAVDDLTGAIDLGPEAPALAALYAERAYLQHRLGAAVAAQADVGRARSLAPASEWAVFANMLLHPALPRPERESLLAARRNAPDDPIWQAMVSELLGDG